MAADAPQIAPGYGLDRTAGQITEDLPRVVALLMLDIRPQPPPGEQILQGAAAPPATPSC